VDIAFAGLRVLSTALDLSSRAVRSSDEAQATAPHESLAKPLDIVTGKGLSKNRAELRSAVVDSPDPPPLANGQVLLAHPLFDDDSPFARTVVLLASVRDLDGETFGVVLNDPMPVTLGGLASRDGSLSGTAEEQEVQRQQQLGFHRLRKNRVCCRVCARRLRHPPHKARFLPLCTTIPP